VTPLTFNEEAKTGAAACNVDRELSLDCARVRAEDGVLNSTAETERTSGCARRGVVNCGKAGKKCGGGGAMYNG